MHPTRRRLTTWLATTLLAGAALSPVLAQTTPTVAAASDLKFALEEVAAKF